jgi:putative transposase
MPAPFQAVLTPIATATDRELARQLQYLRAENRILRDRLPKSLVVTARERQRLLRFGRPLGTAIKDLITIVTPRTFARWVREVAGLTVRRSRRAPGRPRTAIDVRALALRLARENAWGYTRILGELKKLGTRVSRSTVVNILKEAGLDPGPKRGEATWDEFITRHAKTLWACDFFSAKTWTLRGVVDLYILFFIHVGTRRVHVAGVSTNPDRIWTAQAARNVSMAFAETPDRPQYLIRDLDSKFGPEFDDIFRGDGIEVMKVGPRKPNLNAFAERWVRTARAECLDHFLIFGEAHLRHLLSRFMRFDNDHRPHPSVGNRPLSGLDPPGDGFCTAADVACEESLGGLLKHYHRVAA